MYTYTELCNSLANYFPFFSVFQREIIHPLKFMELTNFALDLEGIYEEFQVCISPERIKRIGDLRLKQISKHNHFNSLIILVALVAEMFFLIYTPNGMHT